MGEIQSEREHYKTEKEKRVGERYCRRERDRIERSGTTKKIQ